MAAESNTPVLTPALSAHVQTVEHYEHSKDSNAAASCQLPDGRYGERIQQLESDMIKVHFCTTGIVSAG